MKHLKLAIALAACGFASQAMAAASTYNFTTGGTYTGAATTAAPAHTGTPWDTAYSAYCSAAATDCTAASGTGTGTTGSKGGSNYGNSYTFTGSDSTTVRISAYGNASIANSYSSSLSASIYNAYTGRSGVVSGDAAGYYGQGFGVISQNPSTELLKVSTGNACTSAAAGTACTPDTNSADGFPHSMDNTSGYESLLFNFGKSVTLNSFSIGYNGSSDSAAQGTDATIFEYVGTGDPTSVLASGACSYADLAAGTKAGCTGWLVAGALKSGTVTDDQYSSTANQLSSSNANYTSFNALQNSQYWMIGAYIPLSGYTCSGCSAPGDSFKINGLTATTAGTTVVTPPTTTVPEPSSFALFGIAGAALVASRRRRKA